MNAPEKWVEWIDGVAVMFWEAFANANPEAATLTGQALRDRLKQLSVFYLSYGKSISYGVDTAIAKSKAVKAAKELGRKFVVLEYLS